MNIVGTTTTTLINVMKVKSGNETTYASSSNAVTLESARAAGGSQTTTYISSHQTMTWDDEAGNDKITVTFTATPES
jgi:hypothetical protein